MRHDQHRHEQRFSRRAGPDLAHSFERGRHLHEGPGEGPGEGPVDGSPMGHFQAIREGRGHHGGRGDRPERGERGRGEPGRGEPGRDDRGRGDHGRGGPGWGGPGWGGPGHPDGRGWGRHGGPRVGRGDVRGAALILLSEQPLHGYQIIQRIAERSGGLWRPSPGSVYPALQLLEDEGLLRAQETEGRRVFTLTEAGRTYVEAHKDELTAAWTAVTNTVDDRVRDLRDLLEQVGIAVRQVAQAGTESQVATARGLLVSTRRQLYRILAEDDDAATINETTRL